MIRYLFAFTLLALAAVPCRGQRSTIVPPVEGRPVDFSNIVGVYRIEISAAPLEVRVEEPITMTVNIIGAGPARFEPVRKNLQILPDVSNDFHVEPVPDEDRVLKDKKTWQFVYRLRPKHVNVSAINNIKLVYFDEASKKYQTRYADVENIVVKPKPDPTVEIVEPIKAPDSFWQVDGSQDALQQTAPGFAPSPAIVALALAIPPLACVLGLLAWRQLRPDDARERFRQRRGAASNALAALASNRDFPWAIVRAYLEDRFDFDIDDPTPGDIAAFLKRRGFARECGVMGHAFFQHCDAVRFAQGAIQSKPLKDEAAKLIEALEADPMRALIPCTSVLGAMLIVAPLQARPNEEILAEAQAAFRAGIEHKDRLVQAQRDFSRATDAFLELHQQGVRSAALYRNLGDAAFLADRWPEAIWSYEMGMQIDPNDRVALEHRELARKKVLYPATGQGRPDADTWPIWLYRPSAGQWFAAFVLLYSLACITGACAWSSRDGRLSVVTILAASLGIAAAMGLWLEMENANNARNAPLVVVAANTPFYRGNGVSYAQHAAVPILPRGLEARIIHRRGDWLQLRLSTGEIGWLPRNQVLIVEP